MEMEEIIKRAFCNIFIEESLGNSSALSVFSRKIETAKQNQQQQ